jgi:hypothetical protein
MCFPCKQQDMSDQMVTVASKPEIQGLNLCVDGFFPHVVCLDTYFCIIFLLVMGCIRMWDAMYPLL